MRPRRYILHGKMAVPIGDLLTWAKWFETADRTVAQTLFKNCEPWLSEDIKRMEEHEEWRRKQGMNPKHDNIVDIRFAAERIMVSTVFLGLDHNHVGDGPPILFETMVFNGPLNDDMARYTNWEFAEHGHKVICKKVQNALVGQDEAEGGK